MFSKMVIDGINGMQLINIIGRQSTFKFIEYGCLEKSNKSCPTNIYLFHKLCNGFFINIKDLLHCHLFTSYSMGDLWKANEMIETSLHNVSVKNGIEFDIKILKKLFKVFNQDGTLIRSIRVNETYPTPKAVQLPF